MMRFGGFGGRLGRGGLRVVGWVRMDIHLVGWERVGDGWDGLRATLVWWSLAVNVLLLG